MRRAENLARLGHSCFARLVLFESRQAKMCGSFKTRQARLDGQTVKRRLIAGACSTDTEMDRHTNEYPLYHIRVWVRIFSAWKCLPFCSQRSLASLAQSRSTLCQIVVSHSSLSGSFVICQSGSKLAELCRAPATKLGQACKGILKMRFFVCV